MRGHDKKMVVVEVELPDGQEILEEDQALIDALVSVSVGFRKDLPPKRIVDLVVSTYFDPDMSWNEMGRVLSMMSNGDTDTIQ